MRWLIRCRTSLFVEYCAISSLRRILILYDNLNNYMQTLLGSGLFHYVRSLHHVRIKKSRGQSYIFTTGQAQCRYVLFEVFLRFHWQ